MTEESNGQHAGQSTPGGVQADLAGLPEITQHCVTLFFPFRPSSVNDLASRTLQDLRLSELARDSKSRWLAPATIESIGDQVADRPVWEHANFPVGRDFLPHIRNLFTGCGKTVDRPVGQLIDSYRLTQEVSALIQGSELSYGRDVSKAERRPKRFHLEFPRSARNRLAQRGIELDGGRIAIAVGPVRALVFRTGVGIILIDLRLALPNGKPIPPDLVVEAAYSIHRMRPLGWLSDPENPVQATGVFSLREVLMGLVGGEAIESMPSRAYTSTFVSFAGNPDDKLRERLQVMLSRHYNSSYLVTDDIPGTKTVRHFDNIIHFFALEGASTVVAMQPDDGGWIPEAIRNYFEDSYGTRYLPIIVLAVHEFNALLYWTQKTSFWPDLHDNSALVLLQEVRHSVSRFLLCFRFSYVSLITMHNATNQALRNVLGLDVMLNELIRDTGEIDALLNHYLEQRRERRFAWATVLGTAGVTWLTSYTIYKELIHHLGISGEAMGLVPVVSAAVTGIVAGWVVHMKRRGPEYEELLHHAIQEHVVHKNLS